jgi:hypothetical protein
MRKINNHCVLSGNIHGLGCALCAGSDYASPPNHIPSGTTITVANWQQYKTFLLSGCGPR